MNRLQSAEQLRYALQKFVLSLPDKEKLEVATVFPAWNGNGHAYKADDIVSYGTNGVGDPQLYKVLQAHTSQFDWTPDAAVSLYTAIGITDEGHTVWAQPTGAHDAYTKGNVVDYNGTLYISDIDGNVWEPGVYGWTVYEEV